MRLKNKDKLVRKNQLSTALNSASKWFLLIALCLCALIFELVAPGFFTFFNIMAIMRSACIIGFMAIANLFILNTGGLNFAQGAQITLTGAIIGALMMIWPEKMFLVAILIAFAIGIALSMFVSLFVVKLKVPPYIATLAMQTVIMGFCRILTDNTVMLSNKWGPSFTFIGQGMLFKVIPIPVVIFLGCSIIVHLFLECTKTGRYIYAVGVNPTACQQVGISVDRIKYISYFLSGLFITLAGAVYVSYVGAVNLTAGTSLFSLATCTVMLSATFFTPGKYNIPGIFIASIMMFMVQNGVYNAGGTFYERDVIQGVILVVSIMLISFVRKEGLPSVDFGS